MSRLVVKSLPAPLARTHSAIVRCTRCERLRTHCAQVALTRRAAYRNERYWGRPLPGFGDPRARLLVVGLAPGAHGANRTGRMFTGDRSGEFLMRAMHEAGFANQPSSVSADDGLLLRDAYIVAAVRCAPPDNKPTTDEIAACQPYLEAEWALLDDVRVVIALGRLAFESCWRVLATRGLVLRPKPVFAHGAEYAVPNGPLVIASFHPSQQNTFTGRLTPGMLASVFVRAQAAIRQATAGRRRNLL